MGSPIANSTLFNARGAALKLGISSFSMALMMLAAPVQAQSAPAGAAAAEADESDGSAIIVTGIRSSLANAQSIKKKAETVVDAISASDIGALPDRSVTEALQRVPGVAINRFAGSNDPDHFSVEGSGVVIRGLNFVRSEFNGRDAFAAGGYGQGINFADVPSELLGSVEVYKNSTADMIEGGLAGTVNLNTRKPFDKKGLHVGFNAEANYGDFQKKWTPTGSLLVSDTFETGAGTFGLLADVSYSRIRSRSDGLQITNFQTRDGIAVRKAFSTDLGCRTPLPSNTDTTRIPANAAAVSSLQSCFAPAAAGADGNADWLPVAYAPIGAQFRTQEYDRKRDGVAAAAQYETSDRNALFTLQYLRSHTTNAWSERTFETGSDGSEYNTYPKGCVKNIDGLTGSIARCPVGSFTNYTYDANGVFQKGYITNPYGGWRGNGPNGDLTSWVAEGGMGQNVVSRQVLEEVTNQDLGFNAKIELSNKWHLDVDFDYTKSEKRNSDFSLIGANYADEELDLTGTLPSVKLHKPNVLTYPWGNDVTGANPALVSMTDTQYFQSKNTQFWRSAMDHIEHSTGSEYAVRADLTYKFDEGSLLKELKFGARYADRSQVVRSTTYNWGVLSETWTGSSRPVNVTDVGGTNVSYYDYPNFFRGQANGPVGGWYYNGDMINNYAGYVAFANSVIAKDKALGGSAGYWKPLAARTGANADGFLPRDIQPVTQQDFNAYAMLRFETPDPIFGDVRLSGNIGLRYVNTLSTSGGSLDIPSQGDLGLGSLAEFNRRCANNIPSGVIPAGFTLPAPTGICSLGATGFADLQRWAGSGSINPNVARARYSYLLPSLNLKFGVTDDVIVRFAASKVLTRPQNDYIRNFRNITLDYTALTATLGNPALRPATAWQFDLTAEWYFAKVGQLTFNLFYKDVSNFFYQKVFQQNIVSNGVTEPVFFRQPNNYGGHGKIKGFEIAYQQTFDFLPQPLNGLGMNANYSYIDSKGLPNSFLNGSGVAAISTVTPSGNLPLEQLSKHNVNVAMFYEKGPVSLRAAYNWRSRFLLTASDVIFPFYAIFNEPTGQLDASVFLNVGQIFKFGDVKVGVQGVNLLNEVTKTSQAYTGDPSKLAPRSYFMNDRRFSFILRGNF